MFTLAQRFAQLTACASASDTPIEPGTARDYLALSEHHYRSNRPATITRVLCIRDRTRSAADRFLDRAPIARPVAVLVESLPALSCKLRDAALSDRYGRIADRRQRAALLNAEVRCISRVVVHPQYRGAGLAVRLVREALRTATTDFTEALAAMGHVSPFFARAGMTAFERPPHTHDQRLIDALARAGLSPTDLAGLSATLARFNALNETMRHWLLHELRRWARHAGRSAQGKPIDVPDLLRAARQRLLCEPVYYLHDNRTTRAI